MTCIVALKENGRVYLAGDCCCCNGTDKMLYTGKKVFRNGVFSFGYTSSFRMGQLLEYHWVRPPIRDNEDIDEYLYVDVLDSIKELFMADRYDTDGNLGGVFIMVYYDRVFMVQEDYAMFEIDHFVSVGDGADEAEAVLYTLENIENDVAPENKLRLAIKIASLKKTDVSAQCDIIINTKAIGA